MQVLSFIGLVYLKDDVPFLIDDDHGEKNLEKGLRAFVGTNVTLLFQHEPEKPLDPSKWGGGCCMWQRTGKCPSGHHDRPGYLHVFSQKGSLREEGGKWFVSKEQIRIDMFNGHRCRFVVVPDIEKESLLSDLGQLDVEMKDLQDKVFNTEHKKQFEKLDELKSRASALREKIIAVEKLGKK